MTAEMQTLDRQLVAHAQRDRVAYEPHDVRRTPAQKAAILARLTLQLVALDDEGRTDGNA